jgi:hypothetical protein
MTAGSMTLHEADASFQVIGKGGKFGLRGAAMTRRISDEQFGTRAIAACRGLARLLVLLLLVAHQAGAGVICLCRHQSGAPSLGTPAAHCPAAGQPRQPGLAGDDSDCCAEDGETSVAGEGQTPLQFAGICCRLHAQPAVEAASISQPAPLPAFAPPAPIFEATYLVRTLPPDAEHSPQRARPLYVTQSCYLI